MLRGAPPTDTGDLHLGMSLDDPEAVRARRAALEAGGVTELEWWDEPGHVSLRAVDPDGDAVELFWEPRPG